MTCALQLQLWPRSEGLDNFHSIHFAYAFSTNYTLAATFFTNLTHYASRLPFPHLFNRKLVMRSLLLTLKLFQNGLSDRLKNSTVIIQIEVDAYAAEGQ